VDKDYKTIELKKIRRSGKSGWIFQDLFFKNFLRTSSVLIRRECLQHLGYFDETLPSCEDIDLWLRISKTYPIGFINSPLTVFTKRPKEIKRDNTEDRKIWIKVWEKNYDPDLISRSRYKRRMSKIYAHLAEKKLKMGKMEEGKKALYQAFSLNPFNLIACKNWLFYLKKINKFYFYG
jgi:GT2 family glycosyltransferase